MDEPHRVSREEMVGSLGGLRRVNRLLGGTRPTVQAVLRLLERRKPLDGRVFRLCDVGTGAGDVPLALVKAARRRKIPLHVVGVELNSDLVEEARRATRHDKDITITCVDARTLLSPAARQGAGAGNPGERGTGAELHQPGRFDVVTASLFLHHFPPGEAVLWMRLMAEASRLGIVINDLERHPMAWLGIKTVGPLLSRNAVFRNDAPLSVRRAYTPEEWRSMARRAGLRRVSMERRWAWRVLLTGRR